MAAKTCLLIVHNEHGPAEVMVNLDDPSRRYSRKEARQTASRLMKSHYPPKSVDIVELSETVNR